jgi:hypothetical protein
MRSNTNHLYIKLLHWIYIFAFIISCEFEPREIHDSHIEKPSQIPPKQEIIDNAGASAQLKREYRKYTQGPAFCIISFNIYLSYLLYRIKNYLAIGVPKFCILDLISALNCLTSSALYEPEGGIFIALLNICWVAIA